MVTNDFSAVDLAHAVFARPKKMQKSRTGCKSKNQTILHVSNFWLEDRTLNYIMHAQTFLFVKMILKNWLKFSMSFYQLPAA